MTLRSKTNISRDGFARPGLALAATVAGLFCQATGLLAQPVPGTERQACVPLYSIQKRDCVVEHIYRCDTEAGLFWRSEEFVEEDQDVMTEIRDPEGNILWVESLEDGVMVSGILEMRNPVSISQALRTGSDLFDMTAAFQSPFFVDPIIAPYKGESVQNGEPITVDGLSFTPLRQNAEMQLNALTLTGYADLFVESEDGFFVYGEVLIDAGGSQMIQGGVPVQVIRPGEDGFLKNRGLYDCGFLSDAGQWPDDDDERRG